MGGEVVKIYVDNAERAHENSLQGDNMKSGEMMLAVRIPVA